MAEFSLRVETFGSKLKLIRTLKNLNQEEAAFRCNLRPSHYGELERNLKSPKLDTLIKISGGLEVALDVLLDYGDNNITTIDAASALIMDELSKLCDRDKMLVVGLMNMMVRCGEGNEESEK